MSVEEGYDAARHCGLNIIATLKKQLGDLDRVEQVIKVRRFTFSIIYYGHILCMFS